tara:strand:+ start:3307 stop:3624 length:318 start_codon:yes stop_codon:yes gene_type:complete
MTRNITSHLFEFANQQHEVYLIPGQKIKLLSYIGDVGTLQLDVLDSTGTILTVPVSFGDAQCFFGNDAPALDLSRFYGVPTPSGLSASFIFRSLAAGAILTYEIV